MIYFGNEATGEILCDEGCNLGTTLKASIAAVKNPKPATRFMGIDGAWTMLSEKDAADIRSILGHVCEHEGLPARP